MKSLPDIIVAGKISAAVISTSGDVGQKLLFGGRNLQDVLADAIALDRVGSLEKVMMEKSGGTVSLQ